MFSGFDVVFQDGLGSRRSSLKDDKGHLLDAPDTLWHLELCPGWNGRPSCCARSGGPAVGGASDASLFF